MLEKHVILLGGNILSTSKANDCADKFVEKSGEPFEFTQPNDICFKFLYYNLLLDVIKMTNSLCFNLIY